MVTRVAIIVPLEVFIDICDFPTAISRQPFEKYTMPCTYLYQKVAKTGSPGQIRNTHKNINCQLFSPTTAFVKTKKEHLKEL